MKSTLLELVTSKKFLAAVTAIIVYVAGRFGFDVDPAVLDRVVAALLVYVGAQGVADAGKSAAQIKAVAATAGMTTESSDALKRIASSATVIGVIAMVALAGLVMQPGCKTAGQRGAAAVGAGLHCEEPNVKAAIEQLLPLATQALITAISGDGQAVDKAILRAVAKPFRDTAFQCAMDAAVAAVAKPVAEYPGAPAAAAFEVNRQVLLATWASVRGELGWPAPARGS